MIRAAVLAGFFVVLASATAHAVPTTVSFTGRLKTSQGVVTGNVNLSFSLFSAATGGTALWTEQHTGVAADTGLVFVDLGSMTTLDTSVFNGPQLFLEVTVGSETLSPRLAIDAVPYAMHAGESDNLGGTITAADVVTNVTVTGGGITATKNANTVNVALSTSCASNQVLQWNGSAWACANQTTFTGTAPIAVSGTAISLVSCTAGQVYQFNGTTWACTTPPSYTAGNGLALTGTQFSLATTGCMSGQVLKFNGATWGCGADNGTTYVQGSGISITGNSISLTTACVANQILKFDGTNWGCAADNGANYTAGSGILLQSGNIFATDNTVVARKDTAAGNQLFGASTSPTLFLDYANNRAGVGTATPGQALDVVGNARATDFLYAAPRSATVYVNGASFAVSPPLGGWSKSQLAGTMTSGSLQFLDFPLDLPNGSTITDFSCFIEDNEAGSRLNGSALISKYTYGQGNTVGLIANMPLTTASASTTTVTFSSTPNALYDNSTGGYYIFVNYAWPSTVSGNNAIFGCKVTYTMPRAGR